MQNCESKESNTQTIEIVTPLPFAWLFINKTVHRPNGCLTEFLLMVRFSLIAETFIYFSRTKLNIGNCSTELRGRKAQFFLCVLKIN